MRHTSQPRQSLRRSAVPFAAALCLLLMGCVPSEPAADGARGQAVDSTTTASPSPAAGATPSGGPSVSPTPSPSPTPTPEPLELPRGGTDLFPDYRLVGFSGHPTSEGMGRLGIGDIDERVDEMELLGEQYADGRKVMPVLELITVVVQASPGADGLYRAAANDDFISSYLEAARRHDALLLLNVQPGRSTMTAEVELLEKWLLEPDVGLALDPEWDITGDQLPGVSYGQTSGEEIDQIATYLDDLVTEHELPQKALVFHQVAPSVVTNEAAVREYDGVEVIKSVDGIGAPGSKIETYNQLMLQLPPTVNPGFKLFFEEDAVLGPLMLPPEVLGLDPKPDYVLYE
ncbi:MULTISPECIES: hypothetical protein [unclassified Arthrobacter]|uniref:hypothetical protein n=1 Tax=unclassified Arthrobacter TaxID=235627 RepID=UPI0019632065|nr:MULTISPECIES: hypothetical protein [unclassified Arthrobacter]